MTQTWLEQHITTTQQSQRDTSFSKAMELMGEIHTRMMNSAWVKLYRLGSSFKFKFFGNHDAADDTAMPIDEEGKAAFYCMSSCLAPFLTNDARSIAVRPASELIELFRDVSCTHVDEAMRILMERSWYFDFNDRPLWLQGKDNTDDVYLRAIMVNPFAPASASATQLAGHPVPLALAIIDFGDRSDWRAQTWFVGHECGNTEASAFSHAFDDLIWHLALYMSVATPEQKTTEERVYKEHKRAISAAKKDKPSIFRVVQLHAPANRFGRPVQKATSCRPMTTRIVVRGHYRMQACGPRWSQRELRWIAPFEKGPRGAARAPIPMYIPKQRTKG